MNVTTLQSDNFFNSILKVFPRWMDIRKRPKSSDGGLFLLSIAQEFDQIAAALNEYKKDFFLLYYIGREDKIIDYLYVGHVGYDSTFALKTEGLELTTDAKTFYETAKSCLYQDGYVLIRPDDFVLLKDGILQYKINDVAYGIELKKEHIWNTIDEFALFSKLKRFDGETNKQLIQRILANYKTAPNSTQGGLKNAIVNAIAQNEVVSTDEIIIESLNEENAFLVDEALVGYENIYEYISQLNQDVYKTKKWDISDWEHSFKTLKYIPTKWDESISSYQDGVGGQDSLIVLTGDEVDKINGGQITNVTVSEYEESDYKINEYIKNNDIKKRIELSLTQYQDTLNPFSVNYRIDAYNVCDIQNSIDKIYLEALKKVSGTVEYYLQDLIIDSSDLANLSIEDPGTLKANTDYVLEFRPASEFSEMAIQKCTLDNVSILKEYGEYKLNSDNQLYNTNVKLHATTVDDAASTVNISDIANGGMTLTDAATDGTVTLNVDGMGGNYFFLSSSCKQVSIVDSEYVTANNMILESGSVWTSKDSKDDNSLTIECPCNTIGFDTEGNCSIAEYIDGKLISTNIYADPQSISKSYTKTTNVKFVIKRLGIQELKVSSIKRSEFAISMALEAGKIITTPMGSILPNEAKNKLTVTIHAGTSFPPVVNYMHVGASLKNSVYKLPFKTGSAAQRIDVDTNCIVTMIESGVKTNSWNAKKVYTNNTANAVSVKINTDNFYSINGSDMSLYSTSYNGTTVKYIEIAAGKSISKLSISGVLLKNIATVYLKDLIANKAGVSRTDITNTFVSKGMRGYIVKTTADESFVKLEKNSISTSANIIRAINVPNDITGVFVVDEAKGVETINNSIEVNFEYFALQPKDNTQCIAYNQYKTVLAVVNNVSIIDQFSPSIPKNMNMLYKIVSVSCDSGDAAVYFNKGISIKDLWSIGQKPLNIEINANGSTNCATAKTVLAEEFELANTIMLDSNYKVGNDLFELARYVITIDDTLTLQYEEKEYIETINVNENGFNKLYFSNVTSIVSIKEKATGHIVAPTMYKTLSTEGIISWTNEFAQANKSIEITIDYKYKKPVSISFKNIADLYEIIGYTVDAYQLSDGFPKMHEKVPDGAYIPFTPGRRVTAYCSNANFTAIADTEKNAIKIARTNSGNNILVKAGSYYSDGIEYYHYADKVEEKFDRMSHVSTHNVEINDAINFSMQSSNFMPDSMMHQRRIEEVCLIDFAGNKNISGISSMGTLTACDNFNGWYTFDTDIDFVAAVNGYGIKFEQMSDFGFACIDVTKFVSQDKVITLAKKNGLNVFIGRNILHGDMEFTRSVYIEKVAEFNIDNQYLWYRFENVDVAHKYYIVVKGSGILDDIVIRNNETGSPTDGHKKNIDTLGFIVDEVKGPGEIQRFEVEDLGSLYNRLEMSSNNIIRTGATMDWGLTKLYGVSGDVWSDCTYTATKHRTMLTSFADDNYIMTPAIYVRSFKSVKNIICKVNQLRESATSGFMMQILTCDTEDGHYTVAKELKNTNVVSAGKSRLLTYVKVKITMPKGKVIDSVEIFAEYSQTKNSVLKSVPYKYGSMTTKIYDVGSVKNLRAKSVEISSVKEFDKLSISVRGCRMDSNNLVWTEWKQLSIEETTYAIKNDVSFEDYSLYQFKIDLYDENASVRIDAINFEVI